MYIFSFYLQSIKKSVWVYIFFVEYFFNIKLNQLITKLSFVFAHGHMYGVSSENQSSFSEVMVKQTSLLTITLF